MKDRLQGNDEEPDAPEEDGEDAKNNSGDVDAGQDKGAATQLQGLVSNQIRRGNQVRCEQEGFSLSNIVTAIQPVGAQRNLAPSNTEKVIFIFDFFLLYVICSTRSIHVGKDYFCDENSAKRTS